MSYVSAQIRHDVEFSFHNEHIIAEKHGGKTVTDNLCLSCATCNIFKGSDLSSLDWEASGELTPLFNPRKNQWLDHFRLNDAYIESLSPEGRVTVSLLRFNAPDRITERSLLILLNRYPCWGGSPE